MADSKPAFSDEQALPPKLPDDLLDEEPRQEPPGSFLSSLPQFFVFPAILVATLTAVYLLLRVLAGSAPVDASELFRDLESAGPHGRWQVLHSLATGLGRGTMDLSEVSGEELERLYVNLQAEGETPAEQALMQQYLLLVVAHKGDPRFTGRALAALDSPDRDLRLTALQALGIMADEAALPALRARLQAEDPDERVLALGAVANMTGPEAGAILRESLNSSDSIIARNAALLLASEPYREEAVKPFLLHMLDREAYSDDPTLDGSLRAVMDVTSRSAAREDAVEQFLVLACRAASELGDPDAVPRLENLREADPSLKVRSAAIDALHQLGSS